MRRERFARHLRGLLGTICALRSCLLMLSESLFNSPVVAWSAAQVIGCGAVTYAVLD